MFQDKNEELRRLEALLAEEEADEQLLAEETQEDAEDPAFSDGLPHTDEYDIDRFYMEQTHAFTAYNSDRTDTDLEEFSQDVWEGKRQSISPLVVLACVLATGVLLAVLHLILRYGGWL